MSIANHIGIGASRNRNGETMPTHIDEIRRAAERIRPHVRRTPLLPTDVPGLWVKPECLQLTGSFKARGAFNAVLSLVERQPETRGVVTHSSGNHGQALACAARAAGLRCVVVVPQKVTPAKIDGIRALDATVICDGVTFDNRESVAEDVARSDGLHLIHPYDDWDMIHGAGTVGCEIVEDLPATASVVVPVGGGGQISGIALALDALSPTTKIIGVEPENAADAALSLQTGVLSSLTEDPTTVAEGVKSKSIGSRNFEVIVRCGLVSDIVTVSEDEIVDALRDVWVSLKLAVEATGALPFAAWRNGRVPVTGDGPTVLCLSGGNFDARTVAEMLVKHQDAAAAARV